MIPKLCVFVLLFVSVSSNSLENYMNVTELISKLTDPLVFIESAKTKDDSLCSRHLSHLLEVVAMLDATSKLQSGILYGNTINLGQYDQCLSVEQKTTDGILKGQYCALNVKPNITALFSQQQKMQILKQLAAQEFLPKTREGIADIALGMGADLTLQIALCVPDSCSQQYVFDTIQEFANFAELPLKLMPGYCAKDEAVPYSAADIVAIVIFSLFGALMCLSTLYDVSSGSVNKHPLLTAFSVYTNGNRLLAIKPPSKSGDDISCVHGLRALSIAWVVLGHGSSISMFTPNINTAYLFTWVKQYYSTYLTGATVSVDTFFVMSGTLLAYIFLKHMDRVRSFNPLPFYLHRYLRLTPALAAIVLLEATLLIRMADGPIWNTGMTPAAENCKKNWWAALLYIQNYYNINKVCIVQSWYLSVDTQLFAISPLILLPLWKWPKKTLIVIIGLLLASIAIIASIAYIEEYPGGGFDPEDPEMENQQGIYVPTHVRYGPWLIGILLGYFLHVTRSTKVKINKLVVVIIWLSMLTSILAIVIGAYPFYEFDEKTTLAQNVTFLSLHRLAWGICVAWVIFACKNGYGGPINWFLSWGFWQPISRLSYSLYILHVDLQMLSTMSMRTNGNFSDSGLVWVQSCFDFGDDTYVSSDYFCFLRHIFKFASDMTLGLAASIIWCLAFESPILVIEKFLLGREKGTRNIQAPVDNIEQGNDNEAFVGEEANAK